MKRKIWIKGKPYFLFDEYTEGKTAIEVAKEYKIKDKTKYFIIKVEAGYLFPEERYLLYFNKIKGLL